jgi:hypothetical protein
MAIMMAFMIGIIQTGITLLRLGDFSRFISHAVIVGFTAGASALLVMDQLKNVLGWSQRGDPHDHFLKRFYLTAVDGGPIHGQTLLVALGTILIVSCAVMALSAADNDTRLLDAVRNGNASAVTTLLRQRVPVNATEAPERTRVHRALGEPELVAHDPPAVVIVALVNGSTDRTAMRTWAGWVELEECAVAGTATAVARHARFFGRHENVLVRQQPVQVSGQRRGEGL